MRILHATITGMHCESCVGTIRSALVRSAAVTACDVRLGEADVTFDPEQSAVADLLAAIRSAGAFDVTGFSTEGE